MSETPNDSAEPNSTRDPNPQQPGYWESQAAAAPVPPQPGVPTQPGVQFNPQTGYPAQGSTPPPYPGTPYPPQPGYPPPPYGPPGYPQQAYGQPYTFPGYSLPEHPQANTALIVGIIGLAGGLTFCGVPLLASPFAWVIGQRAKNEIDREPNRWGGRDHANTGMILGIIGTALLALALLGVLIFFLIVASDPNAFE